nr:hypothetical protein [Candidatus Brocadiales bacterium]
DKKNQKRIFQKLKLLETGEFSDERRTQQFLVLKNAQAVVLDIQNWHEFFKSMIAAGYRRSDMISSKTAIVYAYTLYLIGKTDYKIDPYVLRNLIARWMFMSSMTGRYSGSPESIMEQDLNRLHDCSNGKEFVTLLDTIITETLTDDFWEITLPNKLASTAARGPSLFAYYAALNLLGARGLFSNIKVSDLIDSGLRAKKSPLERHHLFPKAHLVKTSDFRQQEINQIANYALVEWQDNIAISDKAPAEYLPEYLARFSDDEKNEMYYWHALPDSWENMEYLQFLDARRKLMAKVTRDGFNTLTSSKSGKPSKWWKVGK